MTPNAAQSTDGRIINRTGRTTRSLRRSTGDAVAAATGDIVLGATYALLDATEECTEEVVHRGMEDAAVRFVRMAKR